MVRFRAGDNQFSLATLLGFTTLCAILAALSSILGVLTSVFLAMMALCLGTGYGLWALVMLAAAFLVAGDTGPNGVPTLGSSGNPFALLFTVVGICVWYLARRAIRER